MSDSYEEFKSYDELKCYFKKLEYKIKHSSCCDNKGVKLRNKDFRDGTYRITKPGYYKLVEDIVFEPNKNGNPKYFPQKGDPYSQNSAYSLGFFAAITIESENVVLDLNGFTIQQSEEFALMQRFFSCIELASSPFIPGQGPGNFGSSINVARNCIIKNGYLRRSSHHGIHGNNNKRIFLKDLEITDFEFVGVALNGSDNLIAESLKIGDNTQNVPVLATLSGAIFTLQFAQRLYNMIDNLSNQEHPDKEEDKNKLQQLMNSLQKEVDKVFNGQPEKSIFYNESGLPDGNAYGFLLHTPGVAINDFVPKSSKADNTTNSYLKDVKVYNIKVRVDEVIGLSPKNGKGVFNGPDGNLLQIDRIKDEYDRYVGDHFSNLQIGLAKYNLKYNFPPLGKLNISKDIVDWSEGLIELSTILNNGSEYKCAGDSMFHLNKGVFGYRFDCCDNISLDNVGAYDLQNFAFLGNEDYCGNYKTSHDGQNTLGYPGTSAIGMNFSYCRYIECRDVFVKNIQSSNGEAVGIRFKNSCNNIFIDDVHINNISAGIKVDNQRNYWRGTNYYGNQVHYTSDLPNLPPSAIGIKISNDSYKIKVKRRKIRNLEAPSCMVPFWTN